MWLPGDNSFMCSREESTHPFLQWRFPAGRLHELVLCCLLCKIWIMYLSITFSRWKRLSFFVQQLSPILLSETGSPLSTCNFHSAAWIITIPSQQPWMRHFEMACDNLVLTLLGDRFLLSTVMSEPVLSGDGNEESLSQKPFQKHSKAGIQLDIRLHVLNSQGRERINLHKVNPLLFCLIYLWFRERLDFKLASYPNNGRS